MTNDEIADRDHAAMHETGRAVLYVTGDSPHRHMNRRGWRLRVLADDELMVTDWPGRHKWQPHHYSIGAHNIAGSRLDVWFTDEHGREWHGINIGDNQILRCTRLKSR